MKLLNMIRIPDDYIKTIHDFMQGTFPKFTSPTEEYYIELSNHIMDKNINIVKRNEGKIIEFYNGNNRPLTMRL